MRLIPSHASALGISGTFTSMARPRFPRCPALNPEQVRRTSMPRTHPARTATEQSFKRPYLKATFILAFGYFMPVQDRSIVVLGPQPTDLANPRHFIAIPATKATKLMGW